MPPALVDVKRVLSQACVHSGDMVDGPGDTVFSQPAILFFIICGGSIVIIFTQCAIVGISAALCCKKKPLGEEAP